MKTFRPRFHTGVTTFAVLFIAMGILGASEAPIYFGASNYVAWIGIVLTILLIAAAVGWSGTRMLRNVSFSARIATIAAWLLFWPLVTFALVVTVGRYSGLAGAIFFGLLISIVEFACVVTFAKAIAHWINPVKGRFALVSKTIWTALGLAALFANSWAVYAIVAPNHAPSSAQSSAGDRAEDAAAASALAVDSFSYGSGADIHRPRYGVQVKLKSRAVDGSAFVNPWARSREDYWGFGPTSLPLNATVWAPDSPEHKLPVVVIVHGDHDMRTPNELGYVYLGELLASRGYFVASIDESFLNSAPFGYGAATGENDLRAWLVLEHLRQLREWNAPGGSLAGRLDLSRVLLIGHSRGGEAVAIAAAFNRMSSYPENARIAFDFNFGIAGVLALAPMVGQYQPADRPIELRNTSYLTLHGTMDADVPSFTGLGQYSHVMLAGEDANLKAAIYIAGANHTQFNQRWGDFDITRPIGLLLDRSRLMPARDQRRIALVYASLFADLVLRGDRTTVGLLTNPESLRNQLPATTYWVRFAATPRFVLADFEEDQDPRTASAGHVSIDAEGVSVWRERDTPLRTPEVFGSQDNHAVFLAWNATAAGTSAYYQLSSGTNGPLVVNLKGTDVLHFSLSDARSQPWASEYSGGAEKLSVSLQFSDGQGRSAAVLLNSFGRVEPTPGIRLTKLSALESESAETMLTTVSIPISALRTANAHVDIADIRTMSVQFDSRSAGAVILDDFEIENVQSDPSRTNSSARVGIPRITVRK